MDEPSFPREEVEGERVIVEWMNAGGTFAVDPQALGLTDPV